MVSNVFSFFLFVIFFFEFDIISFDLLYSHLAVCLDEILISI